MKKVCLSFYLYELQKHQGILLYEYLLEAAINMGISGGIAVKAVAGFGHHKKLHEEQFWDIASNVPIEVKFFLPYEKSQEFFHFLEKERISLFYSLVDAEYGFLN